MSHKSSQKRIEANRRNAQKSTGPRSPEGKTRSAQNATTHGHASHRFNPLQSGCLLRMEEKSEFEGILQDYIGTYHPQHRDELDLLTEAVFAKWKQQRLWLAETSQVEVAMALHERDLQKVLPKTNAGAHFSQCDC